MQILVTTDHNVLGQEGLASRVEQDVMNVLARFADDVTRVVVHLSDDLSGKHKSPGKKCVMEARLAGRAPLAVDHHGDSVKKSYDGAARKLLRLLTSTTERRKAHKRAATRGVVVAEEG
jgi:hypothetical protein